MIRKARTALVALIVLAAVLVAGAAPASAQAIEAVRRPVVFIHGGAGSGAQFQSQAMRFTSNGYPIGHIRVIDYNSLAVSGANVPGRLDALIDELKTSTGADKIDLLGHSLGTGLMQSYLSSPARAANVAHYVNIDGSQAASPPGGVPTLALWAQGSPTRRIGGATNVYIPDQSHVEIATSRESFDAMFRFFNDGEVPATIDIVPDPSGEAEIAGRAVYFPANDGASGVTLEIYEVADATGHRVNEEPDASYVLPADGSWGPFTGEVGKRYEFAIYRDDTATHHIYTQPLIRDDHLVRLNTSLPGEGIGALIERGPNHSSVVVTRYREWWGGHPTRNDVLSIDGTNVLNAATAPVSKNAIGVFSFDVGSDGVTNLGAPIPTLFGLPFLTGVDLHMAATTPPDRTISVVTTPRGDTAATQVVNVPAFASATDPVSIHLNDYAQPAGGRSFTARYSNTDCTNLAAVANASGLSLAAVVRAGLGVFAALAPSTPPTLPPIDNTGPCEVVVHWSAAELATVTNTAAAWGVDPHGLHRESGRLVLAIIWALANAAPPT